MGAAATVTHRRYTLGCLFCRHTAVTQALDNTTASDMHNGLHVAWIGTVCLLVVDVDLYRG